MKPECFFHEIYGGGLAYSGFAPPGANRWLPNDPAFLLTITANQLVVAGDMPILCAAGTVSEVGMELLREAGFLTPTHLHTFNQAHDYTNRLNSLVDAGLRIVIQHVHPLEILPAASCWIAPTLLSWLNDKGNLAELTPPIGTPQRSVFSPDTTNRYLPSLSFPFLLKAASLQSTGGGALDIHICRNQYDLERGMEIMQASERVVAEEWLSAQRFLCLNYAIGPDGGIRYLGGAEIINDADGCYRGNWLGERFKPSGSSIALGRKIAEQGSKAGYRGCLGIDMAELPDGRPLAIDLNFRVCGSTVPLLLFQAVSQATGAVVAKYRSWSREGSFNDFIKSARQAMRSGFMVPLGSFDPLPHGYKGPAKISGLLLGENVQEVLCREAELTRMGWY